MFLTIDDQSVWSRSFGVKLSPVAYHARNVSETVAALRREFSETWPETVAVLIWSFGQSYLWTTVLPLVKVARG